MENDGHSACGCVICSEGILLSPVFLNLFPAFGRFVLRPVSSIFKAFGELWLMNKQLESVEVLKFRAVLCRIFPSK